MATTSALQEYHTLMEFIKKCKVSYAMLKVLTIYCEVVKEIRTYTIHDAGNNVQTFTLKGEEYAVNYDIITACLRIPEYNNLNAPSYSDIVVMLNSIGYAGETDI